MTTPLRIRLPYRSIEEFLSRYGENLAHDSLFVATRFPQAVGTAVEFEVVLDSGMTLLRGQALIERANAELPMGQRGMLLAFTLLDDESRAFLNQVLGAPLPGTGQEVMTPLSDEEPVLGIDFGTETCRAAVFRHHQLRTFSPTPSGLWLTPEGRWQLEKEETHALTEDFQYGCFGTRRLLGLDARGERARVLTHEMSLRRVDEAQAEAFWEFRGNAFSPIEMAAVTLQEVVSRAESEASCRFRQVVLSVPTAFNHWQRQALLEAAQLAGLKVLQLLNDTSATALALAYKKRLPRRRWLVLDLGKGFFSAAVIQVQGDEVEVFSARGLAELGGANFDVAIAKAMLKGIPKEEQLTLLKPAQWAFLAQQAKIELSRAPTATLSLPWAAQSPWAASVGAQLTLKRASIEEHTRALCEHAANLALDTLTSAGLTSEGLDDVICTGGAWQWPQLTKEVGRRLGVSLHPSSGHIPTVAHGAALWGHARLQASLGKDELHLFEVSGPALQLQTPGGAQQVLFPVNARLPADARTDVLETGPLEVIQDEAGQAPLGTLPPCTGQLSTHIDLNGVLSFSTSDDMNRPRRIEMTLPTGPDSGPAPECKVASPSTKMTSGFWARLKAQFGQGRF